MTPMQPSKECKNYEGSLPIVKGSIFTMNVILNLYIVRVCNLFKHFLLLIMLIGRGRGYKQ